MVDWFSRRVLAWRLSITLETEFCLDAVNEALACHGKTPMQTLLDSADLAREKQNLAMAA